MYTKIYSNTRLSDSQTKQTNGGTDLLMDRHVVGLTEKEETDEQRDIKTKHKQGRHTEYIYCHADIQIDHNEKVLTALKRYTSIAQASHVDISVCIKISYIRTTISSCQAGKGSCLKLKAYNKMASVQVEEE